MLGAGLLAKKAIEHGLEVAPFVKTSLSPGSGVVTYYLQESGVMPYLEQLGLVFNHVWFHSLYSSDFCTSCSWKLLASLTNST